MNDLKNLKVLSNSNRFVDIESTLEVKNILNTIIEMDVVELEKHLDEEVKVQKHGKYFLLATLRDIFLRYKETGNSHIIVEQGRCRSGCYKKPSNIINIRGNSSDENFAFVIEKENGKIALIHFCPNFVNMHNINIPASFELRNIAYRKESEMLGEDISQWNDEENISLMKRITDRFNDAFPFP